MCIFIPVLLTTVENYSIKSKFMLLAWTIMKRAVTLKRIPGVSVNKLAVPIYNGPTILHLQRATVEKSGTVIKIKKLVTMTPDGLCSSQFNWGLTEDLPVPQRCLPQWCPYPLWRDRRGCGRCHGGEALLSGSGPWWSRGKLCPGSGPQAQSHGVDCL